MQLASLFSMFMFRVQEDAPENEIITIPYTDSGIHRFSQTNKNQNSLMT